MKVYLAFVGNSYYASRGDKRVMYASSNRQKVDAYVSYHVSIFERFQYHRHKFDRCRNSGKIKKNNPLKEKNKWVIDKIYDKLCEIYFDDICDTWDVN